MTHKVGHEACIVCYAKRHLACWAEVTRNSETIKPVTLAIIALCFSESIIQVETEILLNN